MSPISGRSLKKAQILLVEDNPIVQKLHRLRLEKLGYLVDAAMTGKEALLMYTTKEYSIVLLDCGLPDISGIEVGKKIRQYEQLNGVIQKIPIVMITAYVIDAELQAECKQAGINELISKPIVDNEAMQAILLRWL